jgi:hypothetical protein
MLGLADLCHLSGMAGEAAARLARLCAPKKA